MSQWLTHTSKGAFPFSTTTLYDWLSVPSLDATAKNQRTIPPIPDNAQLPNGMLYHSSMRVIAAHESSSQESLVRQQQPKVGRVHISGYGSQ